MEQQCGNINWSTFQHRRAFRRGAFVDVATPWHLAANAGGFISAGGPPLSVWSQHHAGLLNHDARQPQAMVDLLDMRPERELMPK